MSSEAKNDINGEIDNNIIDTNSEPKSVSLPLRD